MKYIKKIRQNVKKSGKLLKSRFYKMEQNNNFNADEVNNIVMKKLLKLFRRKKLHLNREIFITYTTSAGFHISSKFFKITDVKKINKEFKSPTITNAYFDSIINMKEDNITIKKIMITYY